MSKLRSFGLSVGTAWVVVGLWPLLWHHGSPRWWALALAAVLIGLGLIWPRALRPVFKAWMGLANVLGWVNSRILLGALFYTVFPLVGAYLRLTGNDPMRRRFDPGATTYRMPGRCRAGDHMRHQF